MNGITRSSEREWYQGEYKTVIPGDRYERAYIQRRDEETEDTLPSNHNRIIAMGIVCVP